MSATTQTADLLDSDVREFPILLAQLETKSAAGDGEATCHIATLEAVGAGRPQDWCRALDALQLAAQQQSERAQMQLLLLSGRFGGSDWEAIRSAVDIDALLAPRNSRTLSDDPRIRSVGGFATAAECEWIVNAARSRLQRAEIWDPVTASGTRDHRRSSSAMEFRLFDLDVVIQVVRGRAATITKLPLPLFEAPQVLHYAVGEMYEPHHDYIDPTDNRNSEHLTAWGQRIATFLLYLNDTVDGGETEFPLAGIRYRGQIGDALFFANVDRSGSVDPHTLHAGRAPIKGEKWVFSQWIRERSRSPTDKIMLASTHQ